MQLHELKPVPGSRHKRKRKGRGESSGLGKTAGRGHKGQKARSGGKVRRGFEGGQMPLVRRIPKRGFTNIFKKEYALVNVGDLNIFDDGTEVTIEKLKEAGLVKKIGAGVKLLGDGELEKTITVKVNKVSKQAEEKVVAKGGKVEVI